MRAQQSLPPHPDCLSLLVILVVVFALGTTALQAHWRVCLNL